MSVRDFKSYNDFHGKHMPKQTLAALCVSLREIIETYANGDAQIKATTTSQFNDAMEYRAKIEEIRIALKAK